MRSLPIIVPGTLEFTLSHLIMVTINAIILMDEKNEVLRK